MTLVDLIAVWAASESTPRLASIVNAVRKRTLVDGMLRPPREEGRNIIKCPLEMVRWLVGYCYADVRSFQPPFWFPH